MEILFITGVMGAGKTKELIEDTKKYPNNVCFSIEMKESTGTTNFIKSRNGQQVPCININMNENLKNIERLLKLAISLMNPEKIFIDEIQFLSKNQIKKIIEIVSKKNISLNLYGLSLSFTGNLFESSDYLYKILNQNNIFKISSMCESKECIKEASYNARIINEKVSREGNLFLKEKSSYKSLCDDHYFNKINLENEDKRNEK